MNYRSILSNFSVALVAQALNTIVGVLTSLVVPKLLGVSDFGYWQLFIFYISYLPLFSLGINDGVYLLEGGKQRSEVNKKALSSQFWAECFYQMLFAALIVFVALFGGFEQNRSFIFFATAVYLVLNNLANFLGYLFQSMDESKLYSCSVMLGCVVFLIPLLVMLVIGDRDFRHYVAFYSLAKLLSLCYCMWMGRDIIGAGLEPLSQTISLCWRSIRVGSVLLLSTIAGSLILGIARFMVDAHWGIEQFGIVSLSVSITTFVMTLVSQASMVLFPALRQADQEGASRFFVLARNSLDVLLPLTYVFYAPAAMLLTMWLPQYQSSFELFALLMPLCLYNSKMGVVGNTFLWVLRKEKRLLAINAASVLISGIFALFGSIVLHSITVVFGGAVFAVVIRSIYTESYIAKIYQADPSPMSVGSLALTGLFLIANVFMPLWYAWGFTVVAVVVFCVAYRQQVRSMFGALFTR